MDIEKKLEDIVHEETVRDQFAKMILGMSAGFAARLIVERLYTRMIIERRHETEIEV